MLARVVCLWFVIVNSVVFIFVILDKICYLLVVFVMVVWCWLLWCWVYSVFALVLCGLIAMRGWFWFGDLWFVWLGVYCFALEMVCYFVCLSLLFCLMVVLFALIMMYCDCLLFVVLLFGVWWFIALWLLGNLGYYFVGLRCLVNIFVFRYNSVDDFASWFGIYCVWLVRCCLLCLRLLCLWLIFGLD